MSNGGLAKRLRVARLWTIDPHCRCCGQKTVLPQSVEVQRNGKKFLPKPVPGNLATLQHHDGRLSLARGSSERRVTAGGDDRVRYYNEERTALYCWECNQRENDQEQARAPKILLRARARLGHMKTKEEPPC